MSRMLGRAEAAGWTERDLERIRQRGRQLAIRARDARSTIVEEILVVERAGTRWGLSLAALREVRDVRLTRLPLAKPAIEGVFQLRGRAAALVDLQALVGDRQPLRHGERTLAAILDLPRGPLGLRVDAILGAREIVAEDLVDTTQESRLPFVRAVTRDLVTWIDSEALAVVDAIHP